MEPWEEWSIDVLKTPYPDKEGNKYIIALVDGFSRFVMLKAVKDTSAATAAQFILEVAGIFGLPRSIRSDNASQFVNTLIETLCALVNVDQQFSVAYRPQSNGKIERVNKEIIKHATYIIMDQRIQRD